MVEVVALGLGWVASDQVITAHDVPTMNLLALCDLMMMTCQHMCALPQCLHTRPSSETAMHECSCQVLPAAACCALLLCIHSLAVAAALLPPPQAHATHLPKHGPEGFTAGQQGNAVCIEGPVLNQERHVRECLAVDVLLTLHTPAHAAATDTHTQAIGQGCWGRSHDASKKSDMPVLVNDVQAYKTELQADSQSTVTTWPLPW